MGGASAVHHGRELTLSFEQEMDADADAQEDYHVFRARNEESLHNVLVRDGTPTCPANSSFEPLKNH